MFKKIVFGLSVFLLAMAYLGKPMFTTTVYEHEKGLKTQFGKLALDENNKPIVYDSGIYLRIPIIDNFIIMDKRDYLYIVDNDRFMSKENKDIIADYYTNWKVKDFSKYYLVTNGGNRAAAEQLMHRKIADALKNAIGKFMILEVSRGSIRYFTNSNELESQEVERVAVELVEGKREEILQTVTELVSKEILNDLGIEISHVRFRSLELPMTIRDSIYKRIKSEREAAAKALRATGGKKGDLIRSTADKEAKNVLAIADKQVRSIKGSAEAKANKIYSDAYKQDPSFYEFYKALSSYKEAFVNGGDGNKTLIMVSQDSPFFNVMNKAK